MGATCTLYGWTCDPSRYAQALSVHVYLNGTTFVGSAVADDPNEAAVTASCGGTQPHRWHLNLPLSYRDGLDHSFNSYAIGIDPSGAPNGYNPELNSSPRTINCPLCSSPIPPVVVTNTSACFGSGGPTGSVLVNWVSGTYDVVRRLGVAGTPVIIAPARTATYTDLTAACESTYTYGVQTPAAACGASPIRWATSSVTVKCNPETPGDPTAGNGEFGYIDVTDVSNGDNVYGIQVLAPGAAPAPPYSTWVGLVIGGRVRDNNANCDLPPYNHYYQARRTRGTGANLCTVNSIPSNAGTCQQAVDWFQTDIGDVTAVSNIDNANMPLTTITSGVITGHPNVNWGGSPLTSIARTRIHSSYLVNNSYAKFYNSARNAAEGSKIDSTAITISDLNALATSPGPAPDGTTYYIENNSAGNNLHVNAPTPLNKNIVLMYSGDGTVTIGTPISIIAPANTFVLLAKGDIKVQNNLGQDGDPRARDADLQGIYIAGGTFYDTTQGSPGDRTLHIQGSVIGLGGVILERASTPAYPKDYFNFHPGYVMNLPTGLRFSTRFFNELAP